MRKYQQLFLLLISCISIAVLYMYKSENSRLKYVLNTVNFFGRSDVAVLRRLDNGTKEAAATWTLSKPLPVWQLIGDSFHAYSSFWHRNELVAGGEARTIVVGKKGAVVDFRCMLYYDAGARSVQGKFRFQRDANKDSLYDGATSFTSYNFFCQVSRDFGQPEHVTFTDTTATLPKSQNRLRLRYLKSPNKAVTEKLQVPTRLSATICVDLVNFNISSEFARNEDHLLQFFLFHQALGVENFLVYDYDQLPERVTRVLHHTNINLYALPFNFPFSQTNSTLNIRQIIETDCVLRNINQASLTILLTPNELFYPNSRFVADNSKRSVYQQLRHFSAETHRFELATFAVCFDDTKKLLVDNFYYDPESKAAYKMLLYRLEEQSSQLLFSDQSVELPVSNGFVHRYLDCRKLGTDGLHDWRNSVRQDFMEHIHSIRNEMDFLI